MDLSVPTLPEQRASLRTESSQDSERQVKVNYEAQPEFDDLGEEKLTLLPDLTIELHCTRPGAETIQFSLYQYRTARQLEGQVVSLLKEKSVEVGCDTPTPPSTTAPTPAPAATPQIAGDTTTDDLPGCPEGYRFCDGTDSESVILEVAVVGDLVVPTLQLLVDDYDLGPDHCDTVHYHPVFAYVPYSSLDLVVLEDPALELEKPGLPTCGLGKIEDLTVEFRTVPLEDFKMFLDESGYGKYLGISDLYD